MAVRGILRVRVAPGGILRRPDAERGLRYGAGRYGFATQSGPCIGLIGMGQVGGCNTVLLIRNQNLDFTGTTRNLCQGICMLP